MHEPLVDIFFKHFCSVTQHKQSDSAIFKKYMVFRLRFLYNKLALVIDRDSHLSSITLPWQLLSVVKVVLVYQMLHMGL